MEKINSKKLENIKEKLSTETGWNLMQVYGLENLVGKKVKWKAPASKYNKDYEGIDIINEVNLNERRPLVCTCIEGDELKYAFIDDLADNAVLSYSDSYRFVTYQILDDEQ